MWTEMEDYNQSAKIIIWNVTNFQKISVWLEQQSFNLGCFYFRLGKYQYKVENRWPRKSEFIFSFFRNVFSRNVFNRNVPG